MKPNRPTREEKLAAWRTLAQGMFALGCFILFGIPALFLLGIVIWAAVKVYILGQ